MATTRLMPLHTGKGRTVGQAVSDILDYSKNPQKTDNGRLVTSWQCDSRIADAEFLFTKNQYIQKTGRVRGEDDVIAYHLRQSFVPGEITPEDYNIVQDENVGKWGFFEASSIRKVGNKYVFIYSRNGLPEEPTGKNYNQLAYGYSDSPEGPWKWGGIIVDASGEVIPDGNGGYTRTFGGGNTHGSICEINGQWYVFYHRNLSTFARQAMVEPITVEWDEKAVSKGGEVRISMAEVTSEGFFVEGLNPYVKHSAGIACYLTGGASITPAYSQDTTTLPVVNIRDGVIAGVKYMNFDLEPPAEGEASLEVELKPMGAKARVSVYLRPESAVNTPVEYDEEGNVISVGEGSFKLGEIELESDMPSEVTTFSLPASEIDDLDGRWGVFFVFESSRSSTICELYNMQFVRG